MQATYCISEMKFFSVQKKNILKAMQEVSLPAMKGVMKIE